MTDNYEDIISHPHHVSARRAGMSLHSRAAQFSPFAALTGYDEEICEAARRTDSRGELTEDALDALDQAFRKLEELELPLITVTCFVPDKRKSGGTYMRYTGHFRFLDMAERKMKFTEGMEIGISEVTGIQFCETSEQSYNMEEIT